jgi:hypothetical protein
MISLVPTPAASHQDDPGTPHVLLGAVTIRHNRFQAGTVGGVDLKDDASAHRPDSHAATRTGIPYGTLPSDFIH